MGSKVLLLALVFSKFFNGSAKQAKAQAFCGCGCACAGLFGSSGRRLSGTTGGTALLSGADG